MSQARILIVEDVAVVALDIQQRLETHGYVVVGRAATGIRAIELAEQLWPDLVLMDIRLQGAMDGIEAAAEIRQRIQRPVVFLTAYSEEATLQRAKVVEPFGYILKPFEDRELKTIVEIALYKHQADSQIRRLNRLYAMLSRVSQATVRVESGAALMHQVCQIAVESGGFKLAWFGAYDAKTQLINPVTQAGEPADLVQQINVATGSSANHSPAGTAIYTQQNFLCNNIHTDQRTAHWVDVARNFSAAAGIRIFRGNAVVGVLALYAAAPDVFQQREIELLQEIALELQFALEFLQKDQQRQLAEIATQHRLEFERLVAAMSLRFAVNQDFDNNLQLTLAELGQFLGADRVAVFQLNPSGQLGNLTHEWCERGVIPRKNRGAITPAGSFNWTVDQLRNQRAIHVVTMAQLPAAAAAERELFQNLESQSVLLLALQVGEKLAGLIIFTNVGIAKAWNTDDTSLLQVAAETISRIVTHREIAIALRESDERFRAFMSSTMVIAWAKDQPGRYIYMNPAFEKNFGICFAEWRGKTAADVWPAELAQQITASDQKILATNTPAEVIQKAKDVNGQERLWLCAKFPFTDSRGNNYLGGIGIDVTEQKKLEAQLRQSKKWRRLAIWPVALPTILTICSA